MASVPESLRAELERIRYRHANIETDDPGWLRVTGEHRPQRTCANDREAWPCQTVEVIDLVLGAMDKSARAPKRVCARYWGSDGTLCSIHNERFADSTATRCARALRESPND